MMATLDEMKTWAAVELCELARANEWYVHPAEGSLDVLIKDWYSPELAPIHMMMVIGAMREHSQFEKELFVDQLYSLIGEATGWGWLLNIEPIAVLRAAYAACNEEN